MRIVLLFFFMFFWVLLSPLYSEQVPAKLYQMIDAGRSQIYYFEFENALKIFHAVQKEYPEFPHGYFYEAYITAIFFSQDKTNSELDSLLNHTVKRAVEKGEAYQKQYRDDAEAKYYLGLSHGVLGIYHVLNKNYFQGYLNGRKGKNYLQDAIALDSTFYDAYLGLGIFHYYVDLLPGLIKFFAGILGFHGDREKGIHEIKLAAEYGRFFNVEAEFTHAAIRYFLEGAKTEGLQRFKSLEKRYPGNLAVTLLIGYHYRRHGHIQTALRYFNKVTDQYAALLPQILVMKLYNLGVCYYRLNDFEKARLYFNRLMETSLRKTRYYQAALAYYKGLLAGMEKKEALSERYFRMIIDHKDTKYWYNVSRMYVKHPVDSLMREFLIAENNIYTGKVNMARMQVNSLVVFEKNGSPEFRKSFMAFLIKDLAAKLAFKQGQLLEARRIYEDFINDLDNFDDKFHRSWIYISYARVLRHLQQWEKSEDMLKKATDADDEYTRIIIEREKFILRNQRRQHKT